MQEKKFDINSLRVATPCSVGWETMSGDERTRHCDLCKLSVFNISGMTTPDVEKLVGASDGRLCVRMFRRSDGTVLTADCPVGLRAVRKRVARFAGASLAAILGLFSVSFGQKDNNKSPEAPNTRIVRAQTPNDPARIVGTLTDPNGAMIPGATVRLRNAKIDRHTTVNAEGAYIFIQIPAGIYDLTINSPGFREQKVKSLVINDNEKIDLDVVIASSEYHEMMGVVVDVQEIRTPIDPTSSTVQTTITSRKIQLIPHE